MVEFTTLSDVWNQILEFKKEYPETMIPVGWIVGIFIYAVFQRLRSGEKTQIEVNEFVLTIRKILNEPIDKWRWGMIGSKPSGNSIVFQANKVKLICNYKENTFSVNDEDVTRYINKKEKKVLFCLVEKKVAELKSSDVANKNKIEKKMKEEILAQLKQATKLA